MNNYMKKFIKKFKPSKNLQKPDEEALKFFKKILPNEIIELWEEYGFGKYGNEVVHQHILFEIGSKYENE